METGLLHLHKGLAYLVLLVGIFDLALAIGRARTDASAANLARWTHLLGFLGAGRIAVGAGGALWMALPHRTLGTWWLWLSLALWLGVEALGHFLVRPELETARLGGTASGRLVLGAALQLLAVLVIFGLMSAFR